MPPAHMLQRAGCSTVLLHSKLLPRASSPLFATGGRAWRTSWTEGALLLWAALVGAQQRLRFNRKVRLPCTGACGSADQAATQEWLSMRLTAVQRPVQAERRLRCGAGQGHVGSAAQLGQPLHGTCISNVAFVFCC